MPIIHVDLSGVETFDSLPLGKYYGSVDKIEYREPTEEGKFAQIQATYMVIEGELVGRKQSEFISMSPKAAFRLKRWLNRFGIDDEQVALDIDEDSQMMIDPDLVGINLIFEVYIDPKLYLGEKQVRTRLIEVTDDAMEEEEEPPPKKKKTNKKTKPDPEPEEEDEEEEEGEDDQSDAVKDEDDEDDDEDEEEEAPKTKRTFSPSRPKKKSGPARRVLK